jgi:hypothetical protein
MEWFCIHVVFITVNPGTKVLIFYSFKGFVEHFDFSVKSLRRLDFE